jgi:hypothetical protein
MPITFDGTRGNVPLFLQTFNNFRNANFDNEVMANPFQRANLLLTYMRGPKIQNWAARKGEELTLRVFGDPANGIAATHQRDDENLWNDLLTDLRRAYSEYHGADDAYRKIKSLSQKPGQVDDYIAEFELLLLKAEWARDSHGTIAAFKEGLIEPLLRKCIERRPPPRTLTEWMDAAAEEEKIYYQTKFDIAESRRHRGRGTRRLDDMAHDAKNRKGKRPSGDIDPRPYDPMQVDAARVKRLEPEERLQLIKDGKCFGCKETGHLYENCDRNPNRGKKKKKNREERKRRFKPRARAVNASASAKEASSDEDTEKEDEAPPAYTKKNLMAAIKKLSVEEREDLLDNVALESDQDF